MKRHTLGVLLLLMLCVHHGYAMSEGVKLSRNMQRMTRMMSSMAGSMGTGSHETDIIKKTVKSFKSGELSALARVFVNPAFHSALAGAKPDARAAVFAKTHKNLNNPRMQTALDTFLSISTKITGIVKKFAEKQGAEAAKAAGKQEAPKTHEYVQKQFSELDTAFNSFSATAACFKGLIFSAKPPAAADKEKCKTLTNTAAQHMHIYEAKPLPHDVEAEISATRKAHAKTGAIKTAPKPSSVFDMLKTVKAFATSSGPATSASIDHLIAKSAQLGVDELVVGEIDAHGVSEVQHLAATDKKLQKKMAALKGFETIKAVVDVVSGKVGHLKGVANVLGPKSGGAGKAHPDEVHQAHEQLKHDIEEAKKMLASAGSFMETDSSTHTTAEDEGDAAAAHESLLSQEEVTELLEMQDQLQEHGALYKALRFIFGGTLLLIVTLLCFIIGIILALAALPLMMVGMTAVVFLIAALCLPIAVLTLVLWGLIWAGHQIFIGYTSDFNDLSAKVITFGTALNNPQYRTYTQTHFWGSHLLYLAGDFMGEYREAIEWLFDAPSKLCTAIFED